MMEPCTVEHWENISSDFNWTDSYHKLGFSDWLCPMYEIIF